MANDYYRDWDNRDEWVSRGYRLKDREESSPADRSTPTAEALTDEHSEPERDENGHAKNTSRQAVVIRRAKLRNIFTAIQESKTGRFDDVYSCYGSVYGKNRFAVWLWIFESKCWVEFDTRWRVRYEPTDEELDEVTRKYLEQHGNWDTPDNTCLNDVLKREEAKPRARRDADVVPKRPSEGSAQKEQTEMSWPEMRKAYAEKRATTKEEQPQEPAAPTPAYAKKARRFDREKILAGVRDLLFDASEPMTATAIQRKLGKDAPHLSNVIYYMEQDDRFVRDEKKRWRLATEEEADADEEETPTEESTEQPDRKPGPRTMLNPDLDEQRMAKWRRELGPDKKPYRDDE